MTDWYSASLIEIGDWLNQFTDQEAVIVNPDDEIVAACIAVLTGAQITQVSWQHVLEGLRVYSTLVPLPNPLPTSTPEH